VIILGLITCTCVVHDSLLFGMNWNVVLVLVVVNCVCEQRPILQVSPKRAISPKLELQNLVSVLGSRCSLRRLVLELSDRDSCLGESGSPKRGRDGNLYHFSSNPRPGEVCGLF